MVVPVVGVVWVLSRSGQPQVVLRKMRSCYMMPHDGARRIIMQHLDAWEFKLVVFGVPSLAARK